MTKRTLPRWGLVCVVAVGLLSAVALAWQRTSPDVEPLFAVVAEAEPLALGVGVTLSLAAMVNRGLQYRSAYRTFGLDVDPVSMVRTTSSGYAANKLVRAGGASGLAVFMVDGKRRGLTPSAIVAACAVAGLGSFVALGVLLASTMVVLGAGGDLTVWWFTAAVGFACCASVVAVMVRGVAHSDPLSDRIVAKADRVAERRRPAGRRPSSFVTSLRDQWALAWQGARSSPGRSLAVVAHAITSKVLGVGMLAVALGALGLGVGPSTVLLVYATALTSSFVSIAPGGLGMVEASTATVLIAHGVSPSNAAVAVLLFRFFDLWVPVVVGMALGGSLLRSMTGTRVVERQVPRHVDIAPPVAQDTESAEPAAA